ncbi:hypothetical protein F5H01DRAFT_175813 [Linnemannia elongata]|nr:hypothetical protein F5H01DRAFT_175813 [Linnemannia elongata]
MDSFKEFATRDTHDHPDFNKMYSCFISYIGRQRSNGVTAASQFKPDIKQCRAEYDDIILQGSISVTRKTVSTVMSKSIQVHGAEIMRGVDEASYNHMARPAAVAASNGTGVEILPDTDGEPDRDQEAEESDDDDDELGEIILPHDFHGLFEGLYRAAFRIPKMPKMENTLKTTLFQYVKDHLTVYHDLPKVQQKDLYVAASSVAYLHCTSAETIFKFHDLPDLLEKSKEPEMAVPSTALLDLLKTLREQAQDEQGVFDVGQLVDLIDIEKGSLATKRRQGQKVDVTIKLAIDILQCASVCCGPLPSSCGYRATVSRCLGTGIQYPILENSHCCCYRRNWIGRVKRSTISE